MTYKSIFLDIDGTILKPDHTYDDSTQDAVNQIKEQGIDIFFATGRPLHELDELAEQLDIDSFIGYNGAYAVYQNDVILNEPIDKDIIEQFIEISNEYDHEVVFYTSEKNYFTSLDSSLVTDFIDTFELKHNELFTYEVSEHILGVTVMGLDETESTLYELEANINLAQVNLEGLTHCYDVIRSNVNKGKAIQRVFDLLDIEKDESIAFGDGMNDKEMFQTVGESFAMENSHPDLFQYAKHKTTSVSNSGIFNGLKKLGLVK